MSRRLMSLPRRVIESRLIGDLPQRSPEGRKNRDNIGNKI
jgi:hypothetical protein